MQKKEFFSGLFIFIILFLSGCSVERGEEKMPETIKDIAYDVNKSYGYTVYIRENDNYIPYLVLTSNYNDNVLVLRKYLLPDEVRFKDAKSQGSGGSYYPLSEIDPYLNVDFLSTLPQLLQDNILDTDIDIATLKHI